LFWLIWKKEVLMIRRSFPAFLGALLFLQVSIVVADKRFTEGDVKGRYGFSFQGEVVGVAPVAATGRMLADGKGNITDAVRTINVGGVPATETFTCTLIVNADGTGSAVCPLDEPAPGFPPVETFDFVIEENGKAFRFVGTTPGIVVLGSGVKQ
jgi:hypothetical protein